MSEESTIRSIAIGADHGGFELKEVVKAHLEKGGYAVHDCGTFSKESVDYPVYAQAVARQVSEGRADRGIMIDRAGIGSAMAANKLPGVRAALCYDLSSARNSREHNNANVLTLGSGLIGPDLAIQIVDLWLASECSAERHLRRAAMIEPGGESNPTAPATATSPAVAGGATDPIVPAAPAPRPPAGPPNPAEDQVETLTDHDVQRIVSRIAEMSGVSGGNGSAGQDACTNIACAFCKVCAEANPELMRQFLGLGADRIVHRPGSGELPQDVAKFIDHTLLKPDANKDQIISLCAEAGKYGFASVCVNPNWVRLAAHELRGTKVKVCSVVGFPLGAHVPEIKTLETSRAIRDGAREIDMVINVGALKSGDDELVYRDIRGVTEACLDGRSICKVIIETALLTDDEKVRACKAAKRARADFVKTSTGFGPGGATAADVALMAETVKDTRIEVKASGGIRDFKQASEMIAAGATRLGVSAGVKIVQEAKGVTVSDGSPGEKY